MVMNSDGPIQVLMKIHSQPRDEGRNENALSSARILCIALWDCVAAAGGGCLHMAVVFVVVDLQPYMIHFQS